MLIIHTYFLAPLRSLASHSQVYHMSCQIQRFQWWIVKLLCWATAGKKEWGSKSLMRTDPNYRSWAGLRVPLARFWSMLSSQWTLCHFFRFMKNNFYNNVLCLHLFFRQRHMCIPCKRVLARTYMCSQTKKNPWSGVMRSPNLKWLFLFPPLSPGFYTHYYPLDMPFLDTVRPWVISCSMGASCAGKRFV